MVYDYADLFEDIYLESSIDDIKEYDFVNVDIANCFFKLMIEAYYSIWQLLQCDISVI